LLAMANWPLPLIIDTIDAIPGVLFKENATVPSVAFEATIWNGPVLLLAVMGSEILPAESVTNVCDVTPPAKVAEAPVDGAVNKNGTPATGLPEFVKDNTIGFTYATPTTAVWLFPALTEGVPTRAPVPPKFVFCNVRKTVPAPLGTETMTL